MIEQITLGIIQGITEWLPISSSGMIALTKKIVFSSSQGIEALARELLFLHLGTFFAALFYFFKEICRLSRSAVHYTDADDKDKNVIKFLIIATVISAFLGVILIKLIASIEIQLESSGKFITLLIGVLLFITAFLELKAHRSGYKAYDDLKLTDAVLLGIAQGFAALPGLSRSGLTVSVLLLRKFDKQYALKLSFLMSLPIILGGNILLHYNVFQWSLQGAVGLICSFGFGIWTIHILLKLAEKINFGYFLIFFGTLTVLSVII